MSQTDWIIQVIGFIGLLFIVLSFQQSTRNRILIVMVTGQLIFLIHFSMLGAWTGFAINIVGSLRTLFFRFRLERKWADHKVWLGVFIAAFWVACLITWEGWMSLLPAIAMTIESIGLWMKNTTRIRFINLFPHPFWFTYNMLINSWAGTLTEILVFLSIVIAIFRYDRDKLFKRSKS
jgi:hypothetical protein